uniref:Matrin-type domain-containing protein n=1 Tax=Chrysotila carterae TaxID=13221 RepID=A0A7S4EWH5_CHRCT|mmetsp:Transcript_18840/g.40620  ORF Transcript_18840/g.40620 Transcript_18840/m.40620 type:complete len:240 (+) Transcript_18840:71-790(+)
MSYMDRDWGARAGGGGVASDIQQKVDRRERLRQLALQTVDLQKDPYFMKNHLGSYECKLCLTLHNNEGNYLAHTQGKRHQQNLARRAAKEARDNPTLPQANKRSIKPRKTVKIGKPGYRVTKQMDPETSQRSLLFEIDYPEIEEALQPRHRFMSAYEQRVEAPEKDWQYLLFAAEPYETVGFKIPNQEIDKNPSKFFTSWDAENKVFTLQLYFRGVDAGRRTAAPSLMQPGAPLPPPSL